MRELIEISLTYEPEGRRQGAWISGISVIVLGLWTVGNYAVGKKKLREAGKRKTKSLGKMKGLKTIMETADQQGKKADRTIKSRQGDKCHEIMGRTFYKRDRSVGAQF